MAVPSIPINFAVQTGNQQNYVSWDNTAGATSYQIQRSLDGVTFANYATVVVNSYLDTAVTIGTNYFYQVAGINGSGTGLFTQPQSAVPTLSGEMSLGQLRLASQQRADRVNSNFVTNSEWNSYINQSMFELYDLLVTSYEDYFVQSPAQFTSDGTTFLYPLPDGLTTFVDLNGSNYVPRPIYKLVGVDLGLNNTNNAWVTVRKFNFIDRNRFVYPNTASTIYGVFNLQYRLVGNKIEFIPTPSAGQLLRVWFIPRLQQLLKDNDVTDQGISGWLEYVIVRAAKFALDKEESDSTKLDQELLFLKGRIEEASMNRDVGQPDKVSDTSQGNPWGFDGPFNGFRGGW